MSNAHDEKSEPHRPKKKVHAETLRRPPVQSHRGGPRGRRSPRETCTKMSPGRSPPVERALAERSCRQRPSSERATPLTAVYIPRFCSVVGLHTTRARRRPDALTACDRRSPQQNAGRLLVSGPANRPMRTPNAFISHVVMTTKIVKSGRGAAHLDCAIATASGPAGNRSCPDVSFAARYTASATSDSFVTTSCCVNAASTRLANGA